MATYSSILAWKIPWTEEPGGLQSIGSQRDMTEHTHTHTHTYYPDTITRQGYHKARKLYVNIPDEHRCKNPQQNISKLNSTIH